jgi:hypothetical protein
MLDRQQCLRSDRAVGFGHFPDRSYVLGDTLPGTALLDHRGSDRFHLFHRLTRAAVDPLQRLGRLPGEICTPARLPTAGLDAGNRSLRLALDRRDHPADLAGGQRGPFGKLAHLIGDHRKTPSLVTGTRRLDRRIEGQQVGLVGNLVDRLDDPADCPGTFAERTHHPCGLGHRSGNLFHLCRSIAHDCHPFGRQPVRGL